MDYYQYCFLSNAVNTFIKVYNHNSLILICLLFFKIFASRIHWTLWKHVRVQGESSHSTRPDSRVDLLWMHSLWTLLHAQLEGVITHLSHPQILPQAMIVCQWLLRIWWEWDLQEIVQHNPSVSQMMNGYIFVDKCRTQLCWASERLRMQNSIAFVFWASTEDKVYIVTDQP